MPQAVLLFVLLFSIFACWGDSMTVGNQDGTGITYPLSLSLDLNGRYANNFGIGGQTSAQISGRMTSSLLTLGYTTIIWTGRNDVGGPTDANNVLVNVSQSIKNMVSALGSNNHFLILSITNTDGEGTGSFDYMQITASNNWMSASYPNNYLDIRKYLVSQYNPLSPPDVADYNADIVPASLRYLPLGNGEHLNSVGYGLRCTTSCKFHHHKT